MGVDPTNSGSLISSDEEHEWQALAQLEDGQGWHAQDTLPAVSESSHQLPDRFTLIEVLNQRGVGWVYAARDATDKPVAVKVYRPALMGMPASSTLYVTNSYQGLSYNVGSPGKGPAILAKSLDDEAMATNDVHEVILATIETGIDPQSRLPWISSPLIEGQTLAMVIESRGAANVDEMRAVLKPIFSALEALHHRGLIHGGVTADHVMLTPAGPRLLDTGGHHLRQRGVADKAEWRKRKMLGISPPVAPTSETSSNPQPCDDLLLLAWTDHSGQRLARLTPATDVWSLGLLVFHTACGKSVVPDVVKKSRSKSCWSEAIAANSEWSRRVGLGPWLDRCLAEDLQTRFPSAAEAWTALDLAMRDW